MNVLFFLRQLAYFLFTLIILSAPITFFCFRTVALLLPIKKQRKYQFILFVSCSFLTCMIIYIGDLANLPPTLLLFAFSVFYCCDGIPLQKLTITFMLSNTAFAFNALNDNYISSYTVQLLPRIIFWFFLYLFIRHFAPAKNYELSPTLWKLLFFLTLTPFGIVLSLVLLQSPFSSNGVLISNIVLLLIAIFSIISLLWTVMVLARQYEMEQKEQLYEINKTYYKTLEQQQFEVRRLRHDLANHLQTLSALDPDQRELYLQKLLHSPAIQKNIFFCENQIINAVLNAKSIQLEQEQIIFQHRISIPEHIIIEKTDLCALFANSFDNAIEACQKLPFDKRTISINAKVEKGLFVFKISNPLPEHMVSSVNSPTKTILPKSTKKDQTLHGYGLRSIKEITTRYNGNLEIQTENHRFSLFLYLPLISHETEQAT